jgi:hypothetical protein
MANKNTKGFGLIPGDRLGNTPAISGQSKYFIDAGYGTAIYNGGAVKSASGYIVEGQGSAAPVVGVLNGVFYNAATTLKPTWSNYYAGSITPANSEDITAFVNDDPFQNYIVATDDAAAQAVFLETFDMNASAGDSNTGKSTATLDIGTTGADDKQYRLLRSAEDPENDDATAAYRSVIVVANLLELQS